MESASTPDELAAQLGDSLKELRLQKNLDRKTLCERAGVSMNALRHLEAGQGATVKTLIRIVRALGRQDWFKGVSPKVSINPLHMVRNHSTRQRASRRTGAYGKKEKT